jgi:hypothetical protein
MQVGQSRKAATNTVLTKVAFHTPQTKFALKLAKVQTVTCNSMTTVQPFNDRTKINNNRCRNTQ